MRPQLICRKSIVAGILCAVALASRGCGVDFAYLIPAAIGQLDILQQMVPVESALAGGTLTDEQEAKLLLLLDAREYARDVIGLSAGDNYTTFYDSGGDAVAYNVSAAHKDAFIPITWTFPLVGTVPYLGYFDLAGAEAKATELRSRDLDVFVYPIDAYSGLGFYPNPILSPMLNRRDASLVETVIHELLHATIWRTNDTPFNESLATFVGRTGAVKFFAARFPEDPALVAEILEDYADLERYNAFALELYNELATFYSGDLAREEKIAGRLAIVQAAQTRFLNDVLPLMNHPDDFAWVEQGLPANNAWLLGIRRYHLELDVFERVFEVLGEEWPRTLTVFRDAAASPDPYAYLSAWLGEPASAAPVAHLAEPIAVAESATAVPLRCACEARGPATRAR